MHRIMFHSLAPELLLSFISSSCYKSYINLFSNLLTCVKEKGNVFIMIGVEPVVSSAGFECWPCQASHTCQPNFCVHSFCFVVHCSA